MRDDLVVIDRLVPDPFYFLIFLKSSKPIESLIKFC